MNGNTLNGRPSFWAIMGSLTLVLLFAALLFFLVWHREGIKSYDQLRAEQREKNLAALSAENQKVLNSYRWIDRGKGIVGVPIDRAMQLVVAELQGNHPHPAGPVSTPSPSPANASASPTPSPAAGARPPAAPSPAPSPVNPAPAGANPA
jgi:hypothetical protein